MFQPLPFNDHVDEYESWYKRHPYVFKSEVTAIKRLIPKGQNISGIEVGLATGRFAKALGIREGVEPAENMGALAEKKGISVLRAYAENLPYKSQQFDFVLMNFCLSYFEDPAAAFREAFRVLKRNGCLIVTFIEKESRIGKYYEKRKPQSLFYNNANFYTVEKVKKEIRRAGFKKLEFSQTLFHSLDAITTTETPLPGFGKGSYVLIKANK